MKTTKEVLIDGIWKRFTIFISKEDFEEYNKRELLVFLGTSDKTRINGQEIIYDENKYFFLNKKFD